MSDNLPEVAVSLMQPWPWAILHLGKDVENRTWRTGHRGPILIHASRTFDTDGYYWIKRHFPDKELPLPGDFELGGIVGVMTIDDVVTECDSPWFFGPAGWLVSAARPLPFKPCRGYPSLFKVNYAGL